MAKVTPYSKEEAEIVKIWYPLVGAKAVQQRLKDLNYNRTVKGIAAWAKRRGIKSKNPTKGRFKKGQSPPQKGMKLSPEQVAKSASTQFKKGSIPHNTLKDGAITIRHHSGRAYKWIRISKGNWMHYHRYLWENQYGSVQKGHVVVFRDGDRMNCTIDNLEMITQAQLVRRNHNIKKVKETAQRVTDKQVAGRMAMICYFDY